MNTRTLLIALIIVVGAGVGYYIYQDQQKPDGVSIEIGEGGVSITGN